LGKIVLLDDGLSNKIAAGEVVERPASVVKELIENAVDAGSTVIEIEIEEGGLSKIKVVDNGNGLAKDDCELAFHRHATSKIKNERDLFRIQTLGFRGEALPSIASVARVELKTSNGEEAGTHLILEGGIIKQKKASSSRKGTEMTVTNLFYNTPARLKHLKTVHTELGNITDTVNRIALAHPDVSFKLVHNGKKSFYTNGNGDMLQVVAAVHGFNTAKKMISLHAESLDFTIHGYIAKPEVTRASRQYISVFMNGRFIRNYPVAKAIQEGYHTLLPIGRFPVVVLNIQMDPTLIDVNVHPSKLEARLSKEKELCALIQNGIKGTFRKQRLIPEGAKSQSMNRPQEQQKFQFEHRTRPGEEYMERQVIREDGFAPTAQKTSPVWEENVERHDEVIQSTAEKDAGPMTPPQEEQMEQSAQSRIPTLYPIGQMQGTYILAQNENGLYIIDQHAAQERVKYEFYKEKVGEVSSEVQELLVPLTFEFTAHEAEIIEEHIGKLREVGVFIELFGNRTYLVSSHPSWFPNGLESETIEEIVFQVIEQKSVDVKKLREDAAILMSCKRSIKANRHLRNDEIFSLLESLRKSIDPFTCPHGRPILVHFSTYEMEKMFKRVM
jgi:DNA mismatch repair protein MutL